LKRFHHESQPAFWKRTKTKTLKNGLSSGPTNAWFSCAGAVVQSLNRSQDVSHPRTRASVNWNPC
jgi:hypothetical protein